MLLWARFLYAEVLVDDQLQPIFALCCKSPVAESNFLILPSSTLKREYGFGHVDLVIREILFSDSLLNCIGKCWPTVLPCTVPAIEKHIRALHELPLMLADPA